MNKTTVKIGIIFLGLALASCEKELETTDFSSDYFPCEPGNRWTYYRYDSLLQKHDTLLVSVTGKTYHKNGELMYIWQYKSKLMDETKYMTFHKDSVKFYDSKDSRISQVLLIPFDKYTRWMNPHDKADCTYVKSLVDVTIDRETFSETYRLQRHTSCCNDYLQEEIWYKPETGLIMLERKHTLLAPVKNEIWILIDHKSD